MFNFAAAQVRQRCGKTTRKGTPCRAWPYGMLDACVGHTTEAERAKSDQIMAERHRQTVSHLSPYPACWFWPVSGSIRELVSGGDEFGALHDWQDGTMCSLWASLRSWHEAKRRRSRSYDWVDSRPSVSVLQPAGAARRSEM